MSATKISRNEELTRAARLKAQVLAFLNSNAPSKTRADIAHHLLSSGFLVEVGYSNANVDHQLYYMKNQGLLHRDEAGQYSAGPGVNVEVKKPVKDKPKAKVKIRPIDALAELRAKIEERRQELEEQEQALAVLERLMCSK